MAELIELKDVEERVILIGVANSLSSAKIPALVSRLSNVDFPALV